MTDFIADLMNKMLDEAGIKAPNRADRLAALSDEIRCFDLHKKEADELLSAIRESLEGKYSHGQLYFVSEGIDDAKKALREMDREEDPE